jgi:hypothetical protein
MKLLFLLFFENGDAAERDGQIFGWIALLIIYNVV